MTLSSYLRNAPLASSRGLMNPPLYLSLTFLLGGFSFAYGNGGDVSIPEVICIFISIILFSAATNSFDDYFDYRNKVDTPDAPNTRYRRHPIFDIGLKPETMLSYGILEILAMAMVVTISALVLSQPFILSIIPLGILISYGYTGPPFGFKYRGFGEILVALGYVSVTIIECVISNCTFSSSFVVFTAIGALLFPMVIFSGNIRDWKWDRDTGIRTVPVRIGARNSKRTFLLFSTLALIIFSYNALASGIFLIISIPPAATLTVFMNNRLRLPNLDLIERDVGNSVFLITLISLLPYLFH